MSILYFYDFLWLMASAMSNQRVAHRASQAFTALARCFTARSVRCPSCQRPCRQIWHQLVLSHPEIRTTPGVKIIGAQNLWIHGWCQVYFKHFLTMNMFVCLFFFFFIWMIYDDRWFVDARFISVFVPWLLDEAMWRCRKFPWNHPLWHLKSQHAWWLSPKNMVRWDHHPN